MSKKEKSKQKSKTTYSDDNLEWGRCGQCGSKLVSHQCDRCGRDNFT